MISDGLTEPRRKFYWSLYTGGIRDRDVIMAGLSEVIVLRQLGVSGCLWVSLGVSGELRQQHGRRSMNERMYFTIQ